MAYKCSPSDLNIDNTLFVRVQLHDRCLITSLVQRKQALFDAVSALMDYSTDY